MIFLNGARLPNSGKHGRKAYLENKLIEILRNAGSDHLGLYAYQNQLYTSTKNNNCINLVSEN